MVTNSFKETQKLGHDLVKNLKGGSIFALYGNLGSGKTTFVQGLAKGLGIKGRIISPTFIIARKYNLPPTTYPLQPKSFYHIDLYRIENQTDLANLGLEEILNDPANIIAIEWPEKIEKLLPKKTTNIHFEYLNDSIRRITIK